MPQHAAQPSYVDLSDDTTIRYGTECVICGARYVSERYDTGALAASGEDATSVHRDLLDTFSEAFQDVCAVCYRCHRAACPDCWDSDHRMCGECVERRGLARTPYRGQPTSGPFADGRIARISPGRYSDIARPQWLDHLIANGPRPDIVDTPLSLFSGPSGINTGEPTHILDQSATADRYQVQGDTQADFQTPEGIVTSNTVICPRCGAQNFDFVTKCIECQLQLIQICPACERLNSGQAVVCDACGTPLTRPQGYSQVYTAIAPRDTPPPLPANNVELPGEIYQPVTARSGKPSSGPRYNTGIPTRRSVPSGPPSRTPPAMSEPLSANHWDVEPQSYVPGGADPGPAVESQPESPRRQPVLRERLGYGLESLSTLLLWTVVFVIVASVISAELSPEANIFIRNIIHVDVRQFLQGILTHVNQSLQSGGSR